MTGLLLALAVGPRVAAARAGRPAFALGLDERALPLDALRFVDANGLRERMYNDFEIGSYLLFEGYPRHRVFVDPRLPAYPPELHALLGRADLSRAAWDEAMSRYGVDSALLAYAGLNRRVAWWDPDDVGARLPRPRRARVRAPAAALRARSSRRARSRRPSPSRSRRARRRCRSSRGPRRRPWRTASGSVASAISSSSSTARPRARARAAYARRARGADGLPRAGGRAPARVVARARSSSARAARAPAVALLDRALALGDVDVTTRINRAVALEREARVRRGRRRMGRGRRARRGPDSRRQGARARRGRARPARASLIARAHGFPGRRQRAPAVAGPQIDGPGSGLRARLQIAEAARQTVVVRLEQRRRALEVEVEVRAVGRLEGSVEARRERVETGRAGGDEAARALDPRARRAPRRGRRTRRACRPRRARGPRSAATTPGASAGRPRRSSASTPKAARAAVPRRTVNPCRASVSVSSLTVPVVVAVSTGRPSGCSATSVVALDKREAQARERVRDR